mmetsp:Transcript_9951/g.20271  ORF Transcript_9951/g.20271 Transcript_9951/m.20271 type:complete len:287 (+) Transcript_9951:281-1141(+)
MPAVLEPVRVELHRLRLLGGLLPDGPAAVCGVLPGLCAGVQSGRMYRRESGSLRGVSGGHVCGAEQPGRDGVHAVRVSRVPARLLPPRLRRGVARRVCGVSGRLVCARHRPPDRVQRLHHRSRRVSGRSCPDGVWGGRRRPVLLLLSGGGLVCRTGPDGAGVSVVWGADMPGRRVPDRVWRDADGRVRAVSAGVLHARPRQPHAVHRVPALKPVQRIAASERVRRRVGGRVSVVQLPAGGRQGHLYREGASSRQRLGEDVNVDRTVGSEPGGVRQLRDRGGVDAGL